MTRYCTSCGAPIADGQRFCNSCGTPVGDASASGTAISTKAITYDFSRLRPFSTDYVAGYLTEVADEGVMDCAPRADQRARASFEAGLERDACRAMNVEGIEEVVAHETNVRMRGMRTCALPVWLAHCSWEGHQMLFAVNGDTGRCVGDLPVDGRRRVATVSALVVACLLVVAALFFLVFIGTDDQVSFLGGGIFVTLFVAVLADSHFMGQMRTAVEASDADESFAEEGMQITARWSTKRSYVRKSKAEQVLREHVWE